MTAGEYYKVGQWVKTANIVADTSQLGSNVRLQFYSSTASLGTIALGSWQGTNDWMYAEKIVQAPAGAVRLQVENFLSYPSGTVWFDQASIELSNQLPSPSGLKALYGFGSQVQVSWQAAAGTPVSHTAAFSLKCFTKC